MSLLLSLRGALGQPQHRQHAQIEEGARKGERDDVRKRVRNADFERERAEPKCLHNVTYDV